MNSRAAAWAVAVVSISLATAQESKPIQKFNLSINSNLIMALDSTKNKVDADTKLAYTLERGGAEVILLLDAQQVLVKTNGVEVVNSFMNKDKAVNKEKGKFVEVTIDKAGDDLKQLLSDSFGKPLAKIEIDGDGKEVKQTITAGPGAKTMIENGMITNARLFHPAFYGKMDQWQAPVEISMGKQGYARGDLTYAKAVPGDKGNLVKVKVSGTLTNKEFQPPGSAITFLDAKYLVDGEQTYDRALKEWSAGALNIKVSFDIYAANKKRGSATGTMKVGLERAK